MDISGKQIDLRVGRFEKDLFGSEGRELSPEDVIRLKKDYGKFYRLFVEGIMAMGRADDSTTRYYLNHFVSDGTVGEIESAAEEVFPTFQPYETDLEQAFSRYSVLFPERLIPDIYTFISAFSYTIVVDDSLLGLGLDMYLGDKGDYYERLGIPAYKKRRMFPPYLVTDALRSWIGTEFEFPGNNQNLLSHMIYQGKILYTLDLLLPDSPDSLKMTYSGQQLKWCRENLVEMWFHYAENELLYTKDEKQIQKYMGEAPFTPGFPEGSPGMTGRWIGWQIVRKYMENSPDPLDVEGLFNERDAQKILKLSKFKPN